MSRQNVSKLFNHMFRRRPEYEGKCFQIVMNKYDLSIDQGIDFHHDRHWSYRWQDPILSTTYNEGEFLVTKAAKPTALQIGHPEFKSGGKDR